MELGIKQSVIQKILRENQAEIGHFSTEIDQSPELLEFQRNCLKKQEDRNPEMKENSQSKSLGNMMNTQSYFKILLGVSIIPALMLVVFIVSQSKEKSQISIKNVSTHKLMQLNDWKLFRDGADHAVFKNINRESQWSGKVLILSKGQNMTMVDKNLGLKFAEQLQKSALKKFIKSQEIYELSTPRDEHKLRDWVVDLHDQNLLYINASKRIKIMDDLLKEEKWDVIVEFKPRSPIPQKFSMSTIKNIAQVHAINEEQIKKILLQKNSEQKTYWYKFAIFHGDSTYGNPLRIYKLEKSEAIPSYTDTPFFSNIKSQLNKQKINSLIHKLIKQEYSQVFQNILKNIMISRRSMASAWSPQLTSIEFPVLEDVMTMENTTIDYPQLIQSIADDTCIDDQLDQDSGENPWQKLYRFLVSFCWSDLSVLIKMNVDENGDITKHQLNLLDTHLKPYKNLAYATSNRQKFLENYLKVKLPSLFINNSEADGMNLLK